MPRVSLGKHVKSRVFPFFRLIACSVWKPGGKFSDKTCEKVRIWLFELYSIEKPKVSPVVFVRVSSSELWPRWWASLFLISEELSWFSVVLRYRERPRLRGFNSGQPCSYHLFVEFFDRLFGYLGTKEFLSKAVSWGVRKRQEVWQDGPFVLITIR